MDDAYVVHGAAIQCPFAMREGNVVVPQGHGLFLHEIDQLTVGDSKALTNILTFGVCRSPDNPAVQAKAAEIAAKVRENTKNKKKSLWDKIGDFFCKGADESTPDESFVGQCGAPCVPVPIGQWDNGKDGVEADGEQPLLGCGTIRCMWGGEIIITNPGQPE